MKISDMNDHYHLPDLNNSFVLVVLAVVVLWFPFWAAVAAPDGRRAEFFLLTVFALFGPVELPARALRRNAISS